MATASLQFFIRPQEFRDLVVRLRDRVGIHVILYQADPPLLEVMRGNDLTFSDGSEPDTIFLAADEPEANQLRAAHLLNPAAWGWVEVDVPSESANVLYMAQIGTKSDWYDEGHDSVRENPEGPSLFRRIRREFEADLAGPTWARNLAYGGEEAYASVQHSLGAAEFARAGGELRQKDVDNIVFSIDPIEQ